MLKKIKDKIKQYLFFQINNLLRKEEYHELESLKKQFKKVGIGFRLQKYYSVLNPQFMQFGDNFRASYRFRIEAISEYRGNKFSPSIRIGNNVIFNTDIHIGCINKIEIGDNCLFASRIYITDHHHGTPDVKMLLMPPKDRPLVSRGPVIIKNNVWVGEGVAIMPNVIIGENSIIATNAVVTKDVPPNCVVAGVPAVIIKYIS